MSLVLTPLLLLALAPIGAPPDHAPIHLDSDDDFGLPDVVAGNGVRGGSGTPEDPYVISDWRIAASGAAIRLDGTTVHVRLERLLLEVPSSFQGVLLNDAENVTMHDVSVIGNGSFVWVEGGAHIELSDIRAVDTLLYTNATRDVRVVGNQLVGGSIRVGFQESAVITRNQLVPPGPLSSGIIAFRQDGPTATLDISDNRVDGSLDSGIYVNPSSAGRVCRNIVRSPGEAGIVVQREDGPAPRMLVCNNIVEDSGDIGISILQAGPTDVTNNTVRRAAVGLNIWDSDVIAQENLLHANDLGANVTVFRHEVPQPVFARNLFLENDLAVRTNAETALMMETNYWGTFEDPRRESERTGKNGLEGNIDYTPWCVVPDCSETSSAGGTMGLAGVDPLGFLASLVGLGILRAARRRSRARSRKQA